MILNKTIAIDLAKYGGDGYIEVGYPSFRKQKMADQAASSLLVKFENGRQIPTVDRMIDADITRMLAFIESAPFDATSVESFYEFTDSLDRKQRGSGEALYEEIKDAIERIKSGEQSPSPSSPEAENGSSGSVSSQIS